MAKRQKWFAGALGVAVVVASIVAESPTILVQAGMLAFLAWVALRLFVLLRNLLSPARERFKPQIEAVNSHVDSSLRKSGLGTVADLGKAIDRGINQAADSVQSNIDARNK